MHASNVYFRRSSLLVAMALVAFALLGAPTQANAAFKMTLSDSDGNTVTINDNNSPGGTGLDISSASGRIIFDGSLGVFDIQMDTGTSNAPGTNKLAQLTINSTSISSVGFTGNKTITITLEDTGFFSPLGSPVDLVTQVSTTQLPTDSSVTYQSFVNGNPGTQLSLTGVGGAKTSEHVSITSSPYTLTSVSTITIHGQGAGNELTVQTTGLTAVTVPAPAGVVLALTALPLGVVSCWLRRRKKA